MTQQERGLLLLCCSLGDERVQPLQLREYLELRQRILAAGSGEGEVTERSLHAAGVEPALAAHVLALLNRERWLDAYLAAAERAGIYPITRLNPAYPAVLLQKLGAAAPVLFCRGDAALLQREAVSLVGSRDLYPMGEAFAKRVGALAAQEGLVLVSGGARGADRLAQEACLANGGSAVVFVADRLQEHPSRERTLYCSLDGYEVPFSTPRAHARNRLIHAQGSMVFVAQTRKDRGGTWSGTADNLKRGLSPVFCHDDGSEGCRALAELGAVPVRFEDLTSLRGLK